MKASFNQSLARFSALFAKLSLREQILAVAAAAAAVYFMLSLALLDPQQKKIKKLRQQNLASQTQLATINAALASHSAAPDSEAVSGAEGKQNEADVLKQQIADADLLLHPSGDTSQAGTLIKELLAASPQLTLVSLRTMPATEFYAPGKDASGAAAKSAGNNPAQKTIYRHGVEVKIQGSYAALLSYLSNLQRYPQRLFWADTRLDANKYPESVLSTVVYTLSEEPTSPLH